MSEMTPIEQLVPHPANPRRGNVAAIAKSLKQHGWWGAVVAQRGTNRILVGKHRVEAAKTIGITEVPVDWKDVDDIEALRIVLDDNRASDLATYDDDSLLRNLKSIGDLQSTLFDIDAVETLEAKKGAEVAPEQPFEGGFADEGAEMEARKQASERIAQEMKDVVLVMKPADYAQFQNDVKVLQKRWEMNGVIATTIAAVHRMALEEGDLAVLNERVEKMVEWAKDLAFAVPHDKRAQYGEVFGV